MTHKHNHTEKVYILTRHYRTVVRRYGIQIKKNGLKDKSLILMC
jgi:hypothetical protein